MNKVIDIVWKSRKSKTIWFNVLTCALALADQLAGTKYLNPEYAAMIITIGNMIIRIFFTKKPISEK